MPEYPDIIIYIEQLCARIQGATLDRLRIASPFLLRTAEPPINSIHGAVVRELQRIGKRIVFVFPEKFFLVLHLMINGRLFWRDKECKIPRKNGLAAFDFPNGSLLLTEVGAKKRASLQLVKGLSQLKGINPGGLEVFEISMDEFHQRLTRTNHTLKRALTDPKIFSGIGNAYSDEILHRARLSPIVQTGKLTDEQIQRLYKMTKETLLEWTQRLRTEAADRFPEKVTAFRKNMAVHGRYKKPCPECGSAIQRICYAANETNYCPGCQTDGKLFADRSLSRLLRNDWPGNLQELENMKRQQLTISRSRLDCNEDRKV